MNTGGLSDDDAVSGGTVLDLHVNVPADESKSFVGDDDDDAYGNDDRAHAASAATTSFEVTN